MRNRIFVLLFWVLLLWLVAIPWIMAAAQESAALTPKAPIRLTKVEGRMDHMSIDVKGQRLFATAFDNHTLEVIEAVAANLTILKSPTVMRQYDGACRPPSWEQRTAIDRGIE